MENGELSVILTSDEMISDIRDASTRCKALLHGLSKDGNTNASEAREEMASFNIWVADMEKISKGEGDEEESQHDSKSDCSSDRSSSPFKLLSSSPEESEDDEMAAMVRPVGNDHRQERTEKFKNLPRNEELYESFEKCAKQKVDHLFPKASAALQKRIAQVIARRQIWFVCLEEHQQKTSRRGEPVPALQQKEPEFMEEKSAQETLPIEHQRTTDGMAPFTRKWNPNAQPSVTQSLTMMTSTELDTENLQPSQNERAASTTYVNVPAGTLSSMPKLEQASGPNEWSIHDFGPFFCVNETCSSPFNCGDTYDDWLAHMHSSSSGKFSTPGDLESHLTDFHGDVISKELRPTAVNHSKVYGQTLFQDCPFCGEFPSEIAKENLDREGREMYEALEKHVGDHFASMPLIRLPVKSGEELAGE
ncbi:hypothetical protein Trihar35433_11024 [Trichoderma harzianum]|nr:hypothetical protein Trihar35433_11024 [Trichoderma harzianum]